MSEKYRELLKPKKSSLPQTKYQKHFIYAKELGMALYLVGCVISFSIDGNVATMKVGQKEVLHMFTFSLSYIIKG